MNGCGRNGRIAGQRCAVEVSALQTLVLARTAALLSRLWLLARGGVNPLRFLEAHSSEARVARCLIATPIRPQLGCPLLTILGFEHQ